MSLYYEAENLGPNSGKTSKGSSQKIKTLATYIACLLIPAIISLVVTISSGNREVKALAVTEKARLMQIIKQKTLALEAQANDKMVYPFVGESQVHKYKIKYVSQIGGSFRTKQMLEDSSSVATEPKGLEVSTNDYASNPENFSKGQETTPNVRHKSVEELFNQAVKDTGGRPAKIITAKENKPPKTELSVWDLLPQIKRQVPSFVYSSHNFSSDPYKRSIVLNGKTMREGGELGALRVVKITRDGVVFSVGGVEFTHKQLVDYQGK